MFGPFNHLCISAYNSEIIIEEGQVIPADARLICNYDAPEAFEEYKELMRQELNEPSEKKEGEDDEEEEKHHGHSLIAADQSAITGESLAVDKFMGDTAYYTTGCKRGKAFAVVTAPARTSFVGRTATLVQGAKDQGHFKAIMNSIGTALLVIVVAWILISWIGAFYHHLRIATPESGSENLLHYLLILLVVGVPVGLPVVTTTTLAVGAAYLAKDKAIVQKLTAIESLAVRGPAECVNSKILTAFPRVLTFSALTKPVPLQPTSCPFVNPTWLKMSMSTG